MIKDSKTYPEEIEKAIRQVGIIHRYVMAIDHALLWIAALSFAAFFHLSDSFTHDEALLFSTLVAYGAYLCESGLGTVKEALIVTMRNRRKIQRFASMNKEKD